MVKRPSRAGRTAALVCALLAAAAAAGPWVTRAVAGVLRPTGDLVERFFTDPRTDPSWHVSGAWRWDAAATALVSEGAGVGDLLRTGASHFTGTVAIRLKLAPGSDGATPAARVHFAFDPASGAHRWLEVRAGNPGRLLLGQTGVLGGSPEGGIQSWRTPVTTGAWHEISVRITANKAVQVTLDARSVFTAAAAPLVPGLVGFGARGGVVTVDTFTFIADPDGEPCRECHAGQAAEPLAANVYTYWDGRWWDATYNGSGSVQQGGHGDPGGRAANTCTRTTGCHDLRLPSPGDHRNGMREGRPSRGAQRSVNPYHLRSGYIVEQPLHPWSVQVAFDNYCYNACHSVISVQNHRHETDSRPADANYRSVEFGTHLTVADGESLGVFVDSDLSSRAIPAEPDYAPCVSCHDPHGTGAPATSRNRMLRRRATDPLFCSGEEGCHI